MSPIGVHVCEAPGISRAARSMLICKDLLDDAAAADQIQHQHHQSHN